MQFPLLVTSCVSQLFYPLYTLLCPPVFRPKYTHTHTRDGEKSERMAPIRPRLSRFSETESVAEVTVSMPGVSRQSIDVLCTPLYVKISGLGDPTKYLLNLHLRERVDTTACSCTIVKGSADFVLRLVKEEVCSRDK